MARLRSGLQSLRDQAQTQYPEPIPQDGPVSDPESSDDDDDDQEIPNKPSRTPSVAGSVSLGRPHSARPGHGGLQLLRADTRLTQSLPPEQVAVSERPNKRRKAIHSSGSSVYDIPSSPAGQGEEPNHQDAPRSAPAVRATDGERLDASRASDSQNDGSDVDEDEGMPNAVLAALTGSKADRISLEPQTRNGNRSAHTEILPGPFDPQATNGELEFAGSDTQMQFGGDSNHNEIKYQIDDPDAMREGTDSPLFVPQESFEILKHEEDRDGHVSAIGVANENEVESVLDEEFSQRDDENDGDYQPAADGANAGQDVEQEDKESDSESVAMEGIEYGDDPQDLQQAAQSDTLQLFQEDIERFEKSLSADGEVLPVVFEVKSEASPVSARMRFEDFRCCVQMMKGPAWMDHQNTNWVKWTLDHHEAFTTPGKAIFALVLRVERLCAAAPEVQRLKSQTDFFSKHQRMISHYLSQLELVCQHISHVRLHVPRPIPVSEPRPTVRKRRKMLDETVRRLIPMLLRCANTIWGLAGPDDRNAFTACTLDLFDHFLGFVKTLYAAVMRTLRAFGSRPVGSAAQAAKPGDERVHQAKNLSFLLAHAANEAKRTREKLALEGEYALARQAKQEAFLAQMERNRQAGIDYREQIAEARLRQTMREQASQAAPVGMGRSQSSNSSSQRAASRAQSSSNPRSRPGRLVPSSSSSTRRAETFTAHARSPRAHNPNPTAATRFREWGLEEQTFLLRKIKEAYTAVKGSPQLPDIDGELRRELNRPAEDILRQTEKLLVLMLRKTRCFEGRGGGGDGDDEEELQEWVRRVMSTYQGL